MSESRTQIIALRITPTEWLKIYRQCKDVGLKPSELARLCLTFHANEEIEAYKKKKVEEARELVRKYDQAKH